MTNTKNITKLNIDTHYVMSDIENKIMDIEYSVLDNPKLDRELNSIYNAIQNIILMGKN